MARKRRIIRITKGEKLLYFGAIIAFGLTLLLKIFCGASISNLKMNIEELNHNINTEQKKIESLTMTVNELTSFDNVKNVVKEMGLAYNNDNIIIINR
ncbi:MAG TPA: hypothetical protein GX747_00315 [Tenericutes bacterium]|nr:hypothetical protein [Mycoplasmatota bacterium]